MNKRHLVEGIFLFSIWVITSILIGRSIIYGPYVVRHLPISVFVSLLVSLLASTLMSALIFVAIYYDLRKEKGSFGTSVDYGIRMALLSFILFFVFGVLAMYIPTILPTNNEYVIAFAILLIGVIIVSLFWQLFFIFLFEDKSARDKLNIHVRKLAKIVDVKGVRFFTLNKMWGYNAFAGGIIPHTYTIMVTTSLLEILNDEEILSVLLHEVAHIKERHLQIALVPALSLSVISMIIFGVLGLLQSPIMQIPFAVMIAMIYFIPYFYFRRTLEIRADRFAVKFNGKSPLINALTKIEQKNPTKIREKSVNSLYVDHPLYKRRIELIEAM